MDRGAWQATVHGVSDTTEWETDSLCALVSLTNLDNKILVLEFFWVGVQ